MHASAEVQQGSEASSSGLATADVDKLQAAYFSYEALMDGEAGASGRPASARAKSKTGACCNGAARRCSARSSRCVMFVCCS